MKKGISLILILVICQAGFAQTGTVSTTKTSQEKVNPTKAKTPVTTLKLGKEEKNIPVPQLPDLRITAVHVKFYNSGSTDSSKRYIDITYTIKNDGVIAAELIKIGIGGRILPDLVSTWDNGGCGAALSTTAGEMLNPGAEFSGSFRCFTKLPIADVRYYKLIVDGDKRVTEILETNNSAITSILYQ